MFTVTAMREQISRHASGPCSCYSNLIKHTAKKCECNLEVGEYKCLQYDCNETSWKVAV
jgi:hypothetical protein